MERVPVSTLRQNLSVVLKKVKEGQVVTITSRGHDMAKLVPVENEKSKAKLVLKELGKSAHIGDTISPILEEWDAMK